MHLNQNCAAVFAAQRTNPLDDVSPHSCRTWGRAHIALNRDEGTCLLSHTWSVIPGRWADGEGGCNHQLYTRHRDTSDEGTIQNTSGMCKTNAWRNRNKSQCYWRNTHIQHSWNAENGATPVKMDSSISDQSYVYNELVLRKPEELQLCSSLQIPPEVHSAGWKLWLQRWTDWLCLSYKQHHSWVE